MKKLTSLKVISLIHLVVTTIWTIVYYDDIAHEGWGVLAMLGLLSLGIIGLIASWIIGFFCAKLIQDKPKRTQNIIESVIVLGFIIYMAVMY